MRHADTAIPGSLTSESLAVLAEVKKEEFPRFGIFEEACSGAIQCTRGVEIKEKSILFSKTLLVLEFTCNGGFDVPNIKN
jgi:hypothetical protein